MKSKERLEDVVATRNALQRCKEAFVEYCAAHRAYRNAVKKQVPVQNLIPINDSFRSHRREARNVFDQTVELLTNFASKYEDDAMGDVYRLIIGEIDKWNLEYVRSKYAAIWFSHFDDKFAKLEEFGKFLNGSRPRQNQIRKIAKEPFDADLTPASRRLDVT